jgi:hypothetical protein
MSSLSRVKLTLPLIIENITASEKKSMHSTISGSVRGDDTLSQYKFKKRTETKPKANLDPRLFHDTSDLVSIVSGLESEYDEFHAIEKLNVL